MKQLKILFILIVAAAACKEIFEPPPQSLLEVRVEYSESTTTGSPKISVYGVDQDSIWIYQEQTRQIWLPLSKTGSSSFVMLFDSIPDTLTVIHDTELKYGSMVTGFYYEYWIREIEHSWNRIDSVILKDSAVNNFWHENIRLYIHTLPTDTE